MSKVATCSLASSPPTNETLGCIRNTCLSDNPPLLPPQTQQLHNSHFLATQATSKPVSWEKHNGNINAVERVLSDTTNPKGTSVLSKQWKALGTHLHKCPTSYCLPEHSILADKLNGAHKDTSSEPDKQSLPLRIADSLTAISVKGWVTHFKTVFTCTSKVDVTEQQKKNTRWPWKLYLFNFQACNSLHSIKLLRGHVQTSETEWYHMLRITQINH